MADITWDDVLAFASELSGVASAARSLILAYVNTNLKASVFGGEDDAEYTLARIYLAAHMGTGALPGEGGASGQVTSEAAGGLSRSYAVNNATGGNTDYEMTGYGKKFKALLRARGGFAV